MASLLLTNFIAILRETFKLFTKNIKIFAFISLLTFLFSSVGFIFNFYSIKPIFTDLFIEATLLNITTPGTTEFTQIVTQIKKDAKTIVFLELIYFIINSAFFLFSTTATILAAALIYGEKEQHVSIKDLLLKTFKSWLRPLFTWIYIFFFTLIFFFVLALTIFFIALFIKNPTKLILASIPLGVFATVLFMYFSVTWTLGIVISAVENIRGIKAIGKAGEIIKGMKLQGFMVIVFVNVLSSVVQLGIQIIPVKSVSVVVIRGVFVVYLSSVANMYRFAAYSIIYYMCKKNHGERVELDEGSGYSKVPTTLPLVDDKLP